MCVAAQSLIDRPQVGMAIRICTVIGLHRRDASADSVSDDPLREQRLRLFWSVYSLDRYVCWCPLRRDGAKLPHRRTISCALGRPPTLSDGDIDTQLPAYCPSLRDLGAPSGLLCNISLSRLEGRCNSGRLSYPIRETTELTVNHPAELYRSSITSASGDEFSVTGALRLLQDLDQAQDLYLPSEFAGHFRNPRSRVLLKMHFDQVRNAFLLPSTCR